MPFFSKVFKKDAAGSSSKNRKNAGVNDGAAVVPPKPRWEDAWSRKEVTPEEVQELVHAITQELKARALDIPFLLLPFQPNSDPSAARTFVRSFFKAQYEGSHTYTGEGLRLELQLTEPLVLCSVLKWAWSRIPGGVVGWDAYELFKIGEQDANMARHSFDTFIPLSVDSIAKKDLIFDYFDLLAGIAAHGKSNGLGGRKLSRMAGWWAFEHSDQGKGFEGGYKSWASAADASSHLFFAYLRSRSPDSMEGISGITSLPRSLQALVQQTEYPPETPMLMHTSAPKVVLIVDSVSPTPFALIRRARHFEYRDDDRALQQFSEFDDPVNALTDECKRVLRCISSTNQSTVSSNGNVTGPPNASWSRFEDMGFAGFNDSANNLPESDGFGRHHLELQGLRATPRSRPGDLGRPTTPSWADFLSSGFADEGQKKPSSTLLLPPDKILPPIGDGRGHSSQSHVRNGYSEANLEPGELASIGRLDLDDTFWWVWQTSLAAEETTERKSVFGRCALLETNISLGKWLVMEEQVKGANEGQEEGVYIAEKKTRFSLTKRMGLSRRKSTGKKPPPVVEPYNRAATDTPMSKTSIGPDQHARIQAAAAELARKQREQELAASTVRRGRVNDHMSTKTNSILTLQPAIISEAGPAMQWAKDWDQDKEAIRARYLGDNNLGKGSVRDISPSNGARTNGTITPTMQRELSNRDLPALPAESPAETPVRERRFEPAPFPPAHAPISPSTTKLAAEASAVPIPSPRSPVERKPVPTQEMPNKELEIYETHPAHRGSASPTPPPAHEASSLPPYETPTPTPFETPHEQANAPFPPQASVTATPVEQSPAEMASTRAWGKAESPEASPVPRKTQPQKLKKGGGGGGFRKLFGKRTSEENSRPPQPAQQQATLVPSQQPGVGRRLSVLRKKQQPDQEPPKPDVPAPVAAPAPQAPQASPVNSPIPTRHYNDSQASVSAVGTMEQREADRAFDRFDQGPLEDVPAFVPDSESEEEAAPPPPAFKTRAAALLHPQAQDYPPQPANPNPGMNRSRQSLRREPEPQEPDTTDNESEASIDLGRHISPVQDRWAQIRKNAAERAARLSEDHSSRPSQSHSARTTGTDRTDDGETSGEETIESRVARIKARVAELTGNMDAQGNITTTPVRRY